MNLYHLSERVVELWNQWELRAMILLSLLLQIFLTTTGSRRKYTAGFWLGMSVWLAYLSADWLATISLGVLSRSQGGSESNGTISNASFIPAFWAPVLLVHLGGPDTITAYSVEDNELWSRHLLQLLTQLVVAFYASLRSWWSKDPLVYVVIPIFVSGMIKYGERVWILWLASSDKFRDSANEERIHLQRQIERSAENERMRREIDWDDFDEMSAGRIEELWQLPTSLDVGMSAERIDEVLGSNNIMPEAKHLHEAHFLFQTLKLLFADYLVTFPTHMISYHLLKGCKSAAEVFKLIEVELGFMFDVLYTKVMTRVCWQPRLVLRLINFLSSVSALLAFWLMTRNLHAYSRSDIVISYLLLVGAIVLEVYSAILMLFSDWAMLWLSKQRMRLADSIYRVICSSGLLSFVSNNKRWKASMAQLDLIDGFRESPVRFIIRWFRIGNIKSWAVVDDNLKEMIFNYLLAKNSRYSTVNDSGMDDRKMIFEERGDGVLRRKGCFEKLGWSVIGRDFHESLLLWHIAANRCFDRDSCDTIHCKMSRSLSNYMMYLRIDLPFMLPKELGEAKYKLSLNSEGWSMRIDGDKLADSLKSLETEDGWSIERKWEMITEVWVEMLTYAASQCGWKQHARVLTQGGELLTLVAVLMSHLGLGQQCLYE